MIGIICAMQEEVKQIISLMEIQSTEEISSCTYTLGKISDKECITALSGVGKVCSAVCTQTMILKYRPDVIINCGVAGSISENVKIGDIVVADYVIQHDFDVSSFGNKKRGVISGIGIDKIPCHSKLTDQILQAAYLIPNITVHMGTILTGDQFINSSQKILELKKEFQGIACEMEAGSIGHVCYINKTPFSIIRAISDCAGESSHLDFTKFLHNSSAIASKLLYNYISSL